VAHTKVEKPYMCTQIELFWLHYLNFKGHCQGKIVHFGSCEEKIFFWRSPNKSLLYNNLVGIAGFFDLLNIDGKEKDELIELGALYRAYAQIHTHKEVHEKAQEYFLQSITMYPERPA
jgi:hypothetical protein